MQNSINPIDAIVADMVSKLEPGHREDFEERAGIIEFDASKPRAHAECLALINVLRRHPEAISGLIALQVELDGATQWLLTTDLKFARQHLADMAGVEIAVRKVTDVIEEQYGGVAMLSTVG